jgi:hypothetical protein
MEIQAVSSDYRIRSILGRLEMIIDNENDRIGRDPDFDLKVSNAHKSRCLYELSALFRDTDPALLANAHMDQLYGLRRKLTLNARRVEAHLEAVRAVAEILKSAVQDADGDGTYSQEQFLPRES